MKRRDSLLCALALSALAAGQAAQADPFALRDQNPLIHGVYLPLGRPALPADRSARQDLTLTFSNTTNIDRNRGEELLVDGETTELRWSAAWPLGERWQLMLISDCPYCGAQGAWLRARSAGGVDATGVVDANCRDGCDVGRYTGALAGDLRDLISGSTQ